jgi:hypothetical protein
LLPGNVVINLDGVEINGVDVLIRVLDRDRIGRALSMDVLRMGHLRAIDIHPIERKKAERQWIYEAALCLPLSPCGRGWIE